LKQAQNETLIRISESRKRFTRFAMIPVSLAQKSPIPAPFGERTGSRNHRNTER